MVEEKPGKVHQCTLLNRASVEITGLAQVISFDENQVVLDTELGLLTLKGKGLRVSRLSVEKGEAAVEGSIDSLAYSSNEAYRRSGEKILHRLFH